jgi:hypothetical protein
VARCPAQRAPRIPMGKLHGAERNAAVVEGYSGHLAEADVGVGEAQAVERRPYTRGARAPYEERRTVQNCRIAASSVLRLADGGKGRQGALNVC